MAFVVGVALVVAGCSDDAATGSEAAPVPDSAPPASDDVEDDMPDTVGDAPDENAEESLRDSDPAEFTQRLVSEAIARYEAEGLDAAIAHYSDPANVDRSWYVFIVDGDGDILAHYQPDRVGENLHSWVGSDVNGYDFGTEMLAADESGLWVPYVYTNPARGTLDESADAAFELKNAWVVRHDGLLFGSGWYISIEEFLPELIAEAAENFRSGGLEATLAFYNERKGIAAGLIPAAQYYNENIDALNGFLSGFVASPDGEILAHFNPELIGTDIEDLLGPAVHLATPEGRWITSSDNPDDQGPEGMRVWAMDVDGTFVAGGWYLPASRTRARVIPVGTPDGLDQ